MLLTPHQLRGLLIQKPVPIFVLIRLSHHLLLLIIICRRLHLCWLLLLLREYTVTAQLIRRSRIGKHFESWVLWSWSSIVSNLVALIRQFRCLNNSSPFCYNGISPAIALRKMWASRLGTLSVGQRLQLLSAIFDPLIDLNLRRRCFSMVLFTAFHDEWHFIKLVTFTSVKDCLCWHNWFSELTHAKDIGTIMVRWVLSQVIS